MAEAFERRAAQLEIRARGRRLEGHVALFNVEARIGPVTEIIRAGAFAKALADGRDILGLVDHDMGQLLARTRSKTLRLAEDSKGLAFDLDVPDTTAGRDVLALAERGDVGGASFGFMPRPAGETWDARRRTLIDVDLREISVVLAFPAYEGTTVAARSANGMRLSLTRRRIAIAEAGR